MYAYVAHRYPAWAVAHNAPALHADAVLGPLGDYVHTADAVHGPPSDDVHTADGGRKPLRTLIFVSIYALLMYGLAASIHRSPKLKVSIQIDAS